MSRYRQIILTRQNQYYNNFVGHCSIFCRLKWRIQQDKIYLPLLWANKKEENLAVSQSELEIIQPFAPFSCLFDWKRCHLKIFFCHKMAEKPNEEVNSQSSQLDEEDLQKLVADRGNNACTSPICLRGTKPAQFSNCTINFNTCDYFLAVYKILLFSYWELRSKDSFDKFCEVLPKF